MTPVRSLRARFVAWLRPRDAVARGQLRVQRELGTTARWVVLDVSEHHVICGAVLVPGLPAGTRVRLRRAAVEAMEISRPRPHVGEWRAA